MLLYCWRAEHIYVTAGLVGCWGWALGHTYQSFDMTICEEGGGRQLSGGCCIDPETGDQPATNGTQVVRYRCAAAATTLW